MPPAGTPQPEGRWDERALPALPPERVLFRGGQLRRGPGREARVWELIRQRVAWCGCSRGRRPTVGEQAGDGAEV